jgi:hypothetical protein
LASINKIGGWIILVLGVLAGFIAMGSDKGAFSIYIGLLILVNSILIGLLLIAIGEVVYVLIDIEENTRRSAVNINKAAVSHSEDAIHVSMGEKLGATDGFPKQNSDGTWTCPKSGHKNPMPIDACKYCGYTAKLA